MHVSFTVPRADAGSRWGELWARRKGRRRIVGGAPRADLQPRRASRRVARQNAPSGQSDGSMPERLARERQKRP